MKEKLKDLLNQLSSKDNKVQLTVGISILCFLLSGFAIDLLRSDEKKMVSSERKVTFDKNVRVFDTSNKDLYKGKDDYYKKQVKELLQSNRKMLEEITKIKKEMKQPKKVQKNEDLKGNKSSTQEVQNVSIKQSSTKKNEQVQFEKPADDMSKYLVNNQQYQNTQSLGAGNKSSSKQSKKTRTSKRRKGHKLIVFKDVENKRVVKRREVTLPLGSYVKVKLLTGVRSIESKAYPVLAQVDYAFVGPNKKKIDLTGCFAILKTQGNLSTESVEAQGTKLSCVSKSGNMFEREIDGYVADDKDNIFGIRGKIVSKQDRVAAMAFLSSIVEGVGRSIQQAQVQQQQNALGQNTQLITGDQSKFIAAGGVSNAASLVTQWYLKQAQSLLPYIEIGSGIDTWLVMTKTVSLPNDYFRELKRNKRNEKEFNYYTNILF